MTTTYNYFRVILSRIIVLVYLNCQVLQASVSSPPDVTRPDNPIF